MCHNVFVGNTKLTNMAFQGMVFCLPVVVGCVVVVVVGLGVVVSKKTHMIVVRQYICT